MKALILFIAIFCLNISFAQVTFEAAYSENELVPKGLLESVAWNNTRLMHRAGNSTSCSGIPQAYGIMGLFDQGKDYFNENGKKIARLSGISVLEQKNSAEAQVMAYAIAFQKLLLEKGINIKQIAAADIRATLNELSEIPVDGEVNDLAKDMQVYSIMSFLNSEEQAEKFHFKVHHFDLGLLFGESNYKVLSSPKIIFGEKDIRSENGDVYSGTTLKSLEYGPAIWNPAPPCNYSSRNGVAISAITIHTVQGSYAGAISWAQNCASSVSYHYVIRSSDGQVTQMLLEEEKGWHVGSENPYTIGYEHEGFVDDPTWYTEAMYNSSADLSRDIVISGYGIPPLRTFYGAATVGTNTLGACTKIKGHQHYPNQTHVDPGINWDWEKYYRLVNNTPSITSVTSNSGVIYDSGGPTGNYQNDERELWLIEPANVLDVTVNFNTFDIEQGYDNLFIYDGSDLNAPLIGSYTGTNSPGIITSSGPTLLIEFRSDCGVVSSGWGANYTSTLDNLGASEQNSDKMEIFPNPATNEISFKGVFDDFEIVLINSLGQICHVQKIEAGQSFNVSNFSKGIYTIRLIAENAIITKKLILTK